MTYSGIIDLNVPDTDGYFGVNGANLKGASIMTTYYYSLSNGAYRHTRYGYDDYVRGGSIYGTANPVAFVSLSINGARLLLSTPTPSYGSVYICKAISCGHDSVLSSYYTQGFGPPAGRFNLNNELVARRTLGLAANLTLSQTSKRARVVADQSNFSLGGDYIPFTDTSVTFAGVAPVSESATLTTLITGLLALGMIRRRS